MYTKKAANIAWGTGDQYKVDFIMKYYTTNEPMQPIYSVDKPDFHQLIYKQYQLISRKHFIAYEILSHIIKCEGERCMFYTERL